MVIPLAPSSTLTFAMLTYSPPPDCSGPHSKTIHKTKRKMRNCFLFSGSSGQVNFHSRYVSAEWTNDDKNENKTTRHISVPLTNNTVQDKAMKRCFKFVIFWTTLALKPTKTRLQTIVFHLNHDIQQESFFYILRALIWFPQYSLKAFFLENG